VFFGWLIFLVVWLFFYAGKYSMLENIGIVVVAFLVGIAILAIMWASWGIKYGKKMEHKKDSPEERHAKRRRNN
jgi:hypothetical protein